MNNQYAVSIRHIYTMPDETFNGYELVLWHWDVGSARRFAHLGSCPSMGR